jgi:hypothetical protein
MPSADNAILYYEAGQALVPMVALTDSGDHLNYNSADSMWSDKSGFNPDMKANGILTGLAVTPAASAANDQVDVSGGTLNLNGVVTTVTAAVNKACTRGATVNIYMINSITINAAGAVTVVIGTGNTAPSEVRGAAGGPPFIPVDSVEVAQVRFSGITAAVILLTEVKSIPNTHREMGTFPTYDAKFARVVNGILGVAGIDFSSAPMLNHTGNLSKKAFALYYTPAFATVPKSGDFKRASNSKSVSSTQIYGGAIGAVSTSLGQGGFKAYLQDGVTDGLLTEEGNKLWFKFKPDRLKIPYILSQGYLGVVEQYPAGSSIMAECTISAEVAGNRVSS